MMPEYPNNQTADEQVDSTIIKLAEEYASCDRRSAEINDERKTIRDNAEKLGIPSKAFQHAVGMVKHMSDGERRDYQVGVNRMLKVISDRQGDLFPQEAEKIRKREQRKADDAAKAGRTKEEMDADSDANRRSDPNAGGAQVDLEDAIKAQQEREQAEGAEILQGKSEAWRAGFNSVGVGGTRADNPFIEGSAETRDWLAGFEAATQRAFEAAKPEEKPEPATPPKTSQSARANAKRAAAGLN